MQLKELNKRLVTYESCIGAIEDTLNSRGRSDFSVRVVQFAPESLLQLPPHLGDRLTAGQQTLTLFI